jgi:hypothetical protein
MPVPKFRFYMEAILEPSLRVCPLFLCSREEKKATSFRFSLCAECDKPPLLNL